jgi:hypothetical protein
MTGQSKSKPRKFRGFVALERPDGALVWGTFRPTEDAARAAYSRWNPAVGEGSPRPAVVPVEIAILDIPAR